MNFTLEVKNEIINKQRQLSKIEDFLKGFLYGKGLFDLNQNIIFTIKNKNIRQKIIAFLELLKKNFVQDKINILIFQHQFNLDNKIKNLSSFFAGLFCASGTISNLETSSYHLEISSFYESFIDQVIEKLNNYDFNFQKIYRKQKYVIYIKRQEKIADFLKAIEATNSFFKFEDSKIQRDYLNNINRINNIDFSNIDRIASANKKHIENIEYMYKNNLIHKFNENQLKVFQLFLENPGESLQSMVDILNDNGFNISKSGLNHWLIKLNKIVIENKIKNL
ncbi:hypothetical protein MCSF7_01751 [Mycoplasmopsis columbina SF7]|uniref:Probable cell division protein WhiA n=1 Tax=Mycoplasmopsis columbina SF7 TaxID=1037410 RepID=F9UKD9_9BACT|nr:DNA-binding protein WhiA [Mycoplasmopsis columbina]EGV00144.1 hypothetical protein MCSF7_01751 [Mycoplasmopsis columbina SF7]